MQTAREIKDKIIGKYCQILSKYSNARIEDQSVD